MVNNQTKGTYYVRPLFLLVFFIVFCNIADAQNISKYYTSYMQEKGVLYFIEPKLKFKNKKEHCELLYDLTYLTTNDSVTLNFTFFDKQIRVIDSISFVQDNKQVSSNTEQINIETDKGIWKHRYSAFFSLKDLELVFKQEKRTSILIHQKDKLVKLEIKNKRWKKQSEIMSKIITLIKANIKSP